MEILIAEEWLPQRGPALHGLGDVLVEGEMAWASLKLPARDFEGHFPDRPIAPASCLEEVGRLVAQVLLNWLFGSAEELATIVRSELVLKSRGFVKPEDLISIFVGSISFVMIGQRSARIEFRRNGQRRVLFEMEVVAWSSAVTRFDEAKVACLKDFDEAA